MIESRSENVRREGWRSSGHPRAGLPAAEPALASSWVTREAVSSPSAASRAPLSITGARLGAVSNNHLSSRVERGRVHSGNPAFPRTPRPGCLRPRSKALIFVERGVDSPARG